MVVICKFVLFCLIVCVNAMPDKICKNCEAIEGKLRHCEQKNIKFAEENNEKMKKMISDLNDFRASAKAWEEFARAQTTKCQQQAKEQQRRLEAAYQLLNQQKTAEAVQKQATRTEYNQSYEQKWQQTTEDQQRAQAAWQQTADAVYEQKWEQTMDQQRNQRAKELARKRAAELARKRAGEELARKQAVEKLARKQAIEALARKQAAEELARKRAAGEQQKRNQQQASTEEDLEKKKAEQRKSIADILEANKQCEWVQNVENDSNIYTELVNCDIRGGRNKLLLLTHPDKKVGVKSICHKSATDMYHKVWECSKQ